MLEEHGLGPGGPVASPEASAVVFPENILRKIIEGHTREAGVRGLERCLASICRHCAYRIVKQQEEKSGRPFQACSQQVIHVIDFQECNAQRLLCAHVRLCLAVLHRASLVCFFGGLVVLSGLPGE